MFLGLVLIYAATALVIWAICQLLREFIDRVKLKEFDRQMGGILGFISRFALAIFCSIQWNLIVSGKPIISLIPFFIVGFEFTILFAVFGNIIGLLTQTRLPNYKGMQYYDPRCSGEHFGVLAACDSVHQDGLKEFFQQNGGEVKVFD